MKLYSLSYFQNFGASEFKSLLNKKFVPQSLSEKQQEHLKERIKISDIKQVCLLGVALNENINNIETMFIDFPNSELFKQMNTLKLLIDSWSNTIEIIFEEFVNNSTLFVLSSDFLSYLDDPRPLLIALKKLAFIDKVEIFFLENGYNGYRKWNKEEQITFFVNSGFNVEYLDNASFLISSSKEKYVSYLESLGLSSSLHESHLLYMTTEDASIKPTGGIGTYIKNIKRIDPSITVLMCDAWVESDKSNLNTIVIKSLIEHIEYDNLMNGMGLIEAIKSIIFLLPNINTIEFQDYQSLGFRIVQAKGTGVLPSSLWLRLFMHGGIDYIKYGIQNTSSQNYSFDELSLAVKESYVAKNVNQCFAPSRYLGDKIFQEEFGYEVNNLEIKKLPFDLELLGEIPKTSLSNITQIVYIGKYIELKGWPDFVEAINILAKKNTLKYINKIFSLAPGKPDENSIVILEQISQYECLHLTHNELLEFVKENKNKTLFVVPSRGENYPFVVLEQLLLGSFFIGYNTGGAVEVVDNDTYVQTYFCDPNPKALAGKIDLLLSSNNSIYSDNIQFFSEKIYQRQIEINQSWFLETQHKYNTKIATIPYDNITNDISVVIPIYNTSIGYINELISSIKFSTIIPYEVILINDGSEDSYLKLLENFIVSQSLNFNIRIVSQQNKGLAGARNCGLKEVKTKYAFFIDSDDILFPTTLQNSRLAMELNNSLIATTGYAIYFDDSSLITHNLDSIRYGNFWKPIGLPEAKALSLYKNQYITANVMIKVDKLISLGGWDESDRSTWEDWALYTKLAWKGEKFSLIPWIGYGYRNTPGSMSKTYNQYFGRRRIIRNIENISKLDANIIISLINNDSSLNEVNFSQGLELSYEEVKLIQMKRKLVDKPILYKLLKKIYKFLFEKKGF